MRSDRYRPTRNVCSSPGERTIDRLRGDGETRPAEAVTFAGSGMRFAIEDMAMVAGRAPAGSFAQEPTAEGGAARTLSVTNHLDEDIAARIAVAMAPSRLSKRDV